MADLGRGPDKVTVREVPERSSIRVSASQATTAGFEVRDRITAPSRVEQIRDERRPRFWRESLRRRMLATADLLAAGLVTALAASTAAEMVWSLALLPFWVVLAKLFGLYDRDQMAIRHLTFDELPRIAAWAAAGTASLGALLYVVPVPPFTVAHATVIWFAIMALAAFLRGGTRWLWRRITAPERTIVVGDGELARSARRKIGLFDDMHLEIVELDEALPPGGQNGDAKALVRLVDRIIVATEQMDVVWIGELAAECRGHGVKLSVVSPLRGRAGAV